MFTYSTQPRGSVVHAACLSEALSAQGHEVTLFALSKAGAGFFREIGCPLRLIEAAQAPAEMDALIAQRIGELGAGLARYEPQLDILHAQDCLVASALLEARRSQPALAACPLVRTVHHVEHFESRYLDECQRRSILDADVVLSVSEKTSQDVLESFGRASLLVHNGVDLPRFQRPPPLDRDELSARLGLPREAPWVLSVGGVEPRKNSLRCLRAMAGVLEQASDLVWVIAGGASVFDHRAYVERFEAELRELPEAAQKRIHRTGSVEESVLTSLYRASDVLLGASEHEGFGLSVLEGMAAGLPVVVPRRPPFTEYVPERAARFVDPEAPHDIARALLELYRDPELRGRLGREGRGVAAAFSWERSALEHGRVYAHAPAQA
jgi:glycosyltransferase-like protein